MKVAEVLKEGTQALCFVGIENGRMEAASLLSEVTGKRKEWFATYPEAELSEEECQKFQELVALRIEGKPLQYLLGYTYFMGLPFTVNENVLIPRADTEVLVETVLQRLETKEMPRILDMCTGSGCIAISLKHYLANAEVYASDISEKALETAQKNAKQNQADVCFIHSDKWQAIPEIKFDAIVSNPPYITKDELAELQKEVTYEPMLALDGGVDGLEFYREIIQNSEKYLKDGGILALEIGFRQGDAVSELLKEKKYREIEVIKDYSGNQRVVIAKWFAGGVHESN